MLPGVVRFLPHCLVLLFVDVCLRTLRGDVCCAGFLVEATQPALRGYIISDIRYSVKGWLKNSAKSAII